ncbi:hypothetical protein VNO80_02571 [Phaseolus coccineus]|uniref:Uncharacterized protein n=1 Tax=Phaseolus coccineus TaxID=3886 RepID=A0AAN9RLM9_PHACN
MAPTLSFCFVSSRPSLSLSQSESESESDVFIYFHSLPLVGIGLHHPLTLRLGVVSKSGYVSRIFNILGLRLIFLLCFRSAQMTKNR